jgi:hypothetical protein
MTEGKTILREISGKKTLPGYLAQFNPNSEVEFPRWRSAAVSAAARWDGQAVGKYSMA